MLFPEPFDNELDALKRAHPLFAVSRGHRGRWYALPCWQHNTREYLEAPTSMELAELMNQEIADCRLRQLPRDHGAWRGQRTLRTF